MAEDAPHQSWQPDRYAANARFVAELGAPVVELLAPRPGERILDLGSGDGALRERLAALGCAVVGVDAPRRAKAEARCGVPSVPRYKIERSQSCRGLPSRSRQD